MLVKKTVGIAAVALCAGLALPSMPAIAAGDGGLAALNRLDHGAWELRDTHANRVVRRLCLGDVRLLLQPRHPGASCARFVAEDAPDHVVVTYNCAGQGNGRTRVRIETSRLATIDSQGIADSAPFAMTLEARQVGACD